MNQAQQIRNLSQLRTDTARLRDQLLREINCLERQLDRLRTRDDLLDVMTLQTYEEMIAARREMLETLPWESDHAYR